jgi:small subunit ribosomal protein S8
MTDPIADLLTRIRNAMQARHGNVVIPRSNLKLEIVKILKSEGFIEGYVEVDGEHQGSIKVFPKYDASNKGVIRGIERISKPSRRVYVGRNDIPQVRNGLGVAILTTPGGVLTDRQARDKGVGGEVLCYVW